MESPRGLFESLITEALAARLATLEGRVLVRRDELRSAEAADRIALHLGRVIRRSLESVSDDDRAATGAALVLRVLDQVRAVVGDAPVDGEAIVQPAAVLRALLARRPDGSADEITAPLVPLLDTTLLTNAPGEPRVGSQILAEIASADRIDVVMAFIRRTGLHPMMDALRRHCEQGRALRVLTTTYTGTTEAAALEELRTAHADVRISYDVGSTRLHAKAWLFHRDSGFSTAYIGSSNLTHAAQVSGLEWNVRVAAARNPDVVARVAAIFESYWNGDDFVPYDASEFATRAATVTGDRVTRLSPVELRPEPFQERLLEQVALSRAQGRHRNLLVSATGTGKTVMAAIDYARLRATLPRSRLLVVAHREEILDQCLWTFRQGLRDASFGELWVGGRRPVRFDHVFASIQSLSAANLADLPRDHFDVVVVDEFHHAAAPTYRRLLDHLTPVELLGLTATPERADGVTVADWFGGRIAAELRLWDAIDQHRLVPFAYYGVHDGLDLRSVPWRRGRGYDVERLSQLLTADELWARRVVEQVVRRVGDPRAIRALGFCVSVEHARFMARVFADAGIRSRAVWGDSPESDRRSALADLTERRINVLFSVDLFNEGVDVPAVDTLLLLRPTDSPTLFLQQLGRGLRRSLGKAVCTILDFVALHRAEYRFDRRFRALLGGTRKDLVRQVEGGFPFLPAGCDMSLDPVAADIVLRNVRDSIPARWPAKVEELRALARTGPVSLIRYLEESQIDLEDVYAGGKSWSDLLEDAGFAASRRGDHDASLRRACGRLLHVDDRVRIDTWSEFLAANGPPRPEALDEERRRLLRMLVASVTDEVIRKGTSLEEATALLWSHESVRHELREILPALGTQIDHLHERLERPLRVPLQVHARYSRIEILAAFGVGTGAKVAPWQTGVYHVKEAPVDLLAFTLDKTSGQFSPTTRYRDHAVSRELIHWESQSTTRADSDTGRRYQEHVARGSSVMLFARLRAEDRAFWFLGPASYVRHEGELPMAITWRLRHPLPGDLFSSFAAAVA